jgi:hypothetical protein
METISLIGKFDTEIKLSQKDLISVNDLNIF